MTKRKNIIRHKVDALGGKIIDFNSLDTGGAALTRRELAFIFWYTYPGSEAFMNAGRAAVRAGYKPKSSVMLGYRARRKPEIAAAITKILDERVGPGLRESLWCITWLCRIRMLFDVSDFYRPGKRIVKARGKETEINTYEIIP
ncbi:MAG: terminase small subunit, partial [Treponema sp.]|nr:terminase small subunit [Treponema sp.]